MIGYLLSMSTLFRLNALVFATSFIPSLPDHDEFASGGHSSRALEKNHG
jgi:hypothetical protein